MSTVRKYNYNGYIEGSSLDSTHKKELYNYYGKSIKDIEPNKFYELNFTGKFLKQGDEKQEEKCFCPSAQGKKST